MPNDLTDRIAASLDRVAGDLLLTDGRVAYVAEVVARDLGDIEARAALAERNRIVAEVRAMADEHRHNPNLNPPYGDQIGAIVDNVADRINFAADPNSEG